MAYTSVIANEMLHKVCKPAAATRKLIKDDTRILCNVVAFHFIYKRGDSKKNKAKQYTDMFNLVNNLINSLLNKYLSYKYLYIMYISSFKIRKLFLETY